MRAILTALLLAAAATGARAEGFGVKAAYDRALQLRAAGDAAGCDRVLRAAYEQTHATLLLDTAARCGEAGGDLRGGVYVDARPRAQLRVDGQLVGFTPWSGLLDDGPHEIQLSGRDLLPSEHSLTVQRGAVVELAVAMSRWHCLCWIEVRSSPSGATVYLDDEGLGAIGHTPYMGDLVPGRHTLILEKEGYKTQRIEFDYAAGNPYKLEATLEADDVAFLHLESTPEGGAVFIDGIQVCHEAPCRVRLATGVYQLDVHKSGFDPMRQRVELPRGTETRVTATLAPPAPQTARWIAGAVSLAALAGGGALFFAGDGDATRWAAAGLLGAGVAAGAFAIFYHPASRSVGMTTTTRF